MDRSALVSGEIHVFTKEAAERMGVRPCTITRWRTLGYLTPVEGSPARKPLYRLSDVEDAEYTARQNAIRFCGSDAQVQRNREAAGA